MGKESVLFNHIHNLVAEMDATWFLYPSELFQWNYQQRADIEQFLRDVELIEHSFEERKYSRSHTAMHQDTKQLLKEFYMQHIDPETRLSMQEYIQKQFDHYSVNTSKFYWLYSLFDWIELLLIIITLIICILCFTHIFSFTVWWSILFMSSCIAIVILLFRQTRTWWGLITVLLFFCALIRVIQLSVAL